MNTLFIILAVVGGVFLGLLVGILIFKTRFTRKEVVGKLKMICTTEETNPYMFLEISDPNFIISSNKKFIFLKVVRIIYDDKEDKIISQK